MLLQLSEVPGLVRLVHSNTAPPHAMQLVSEQQQPPSSPDEPPFLVTAPFGRCLDMADDADIILGSIACAAQTVGRMAQQTPPVLHRDLSLGNLIIVPEILEKAPQDDKLEGAFLLDLATSCEAPDGRFPIDVVELAGTPLFMARTIMEGGDHTQSSDLESLLLVLIYLGCKGHVHWANSRVGSREALPLKVYALLPGESFEKYVRQRCRPDLLPAVDSLHKLFFVPVYNREVTSQQFLGALSG